MQTEKAGLYSQQLCSASICLGRYILSWVLYGGRPRHIYHVATRSDLHIIDAEFKPLWGDRVPDVGYHQFAGFMLNVSSSAYLYYPFKTLPEGEEIDTGHRGLPHQ